jgi:hypothetical protein
MGIQQRGEGRGVKARYIQHHIPEDDILQYGDIIKLKTNGVGISFTRLM